MVVVAKVVKELVLESVGFVVVVAAVEVVIVGDVELREVEAEVKEDDIEEATVEVTRAPVEEDEVKELVEVVIVERVPNEPLLFTPAVVTVIDVDVGVVLDAMEVKEAVLEEEINVEALIVKVVEAVFKVVLDTVDVVDLLEEDAVAVLIYNVDNPGVVVEVLVFEVIDDGLVDVNIVVPSGDEVKKEVVDIVGLVK